MSGHQLLGEPRALSAMPDNFRLHRTLRAPCVQQANTQRLAPQRAALALPVNTRWVVLRTACLVETDATPVRAAREPARIATQDFV